MTKVYKDKAMTSYRSKVVKKQKEENITVEFRREASFAWTTYKPHTPYEVSKDVYEVVKKFVK